MLIKPTLLPFETNKSNTSYLKRTRVKNEKKEDNDNLLGTAERNSLWRTGGFRCNQLETHNATATILHYSDCDSRWHSTKFVINVRA